jgi:monoamine oxidase
LATETGSGERVASKSEWDVIVLGGGFAGVAAARDCQKNGYRVLLLEARNRLGGRTFTSQFDGSAIEYGGTWVYNNQPFVWAEIERYGLDLAETPGALPDQMVLLTGGSRLSLSEQQIVDAATGWNTYTAGVRSIVPRPFDLLHNEPSALAADAISAQEHLETLHLPPLQHAFCKGMIELTCSGAADAVSHLEMLRFYMLAGADFANFMDSVARFKLKEGTARLIDEMITDAKAEVRLATPVRAVEDRGDSVRVVTQRGEYFDGRVVISTLPLNTIADVAFTPALPTGVVEAARQRHPGGGAKIYLQLEGDVGNLATIAPGRPINYPLTYEQAPTHTLLTAFSSDLTAIDPYDDEALQREIEFHIPGARLVASTHYDWNNDPYSRGTWATYRPGWAGQLIADFQRPQGRVHFASGDHGEGWRGTIDGAIGAGVRAAQTVRSQLGDPV